LDRGYVSVTDYDFGDYPQRCFYEAFAKTLLLPFYGKIEGKQASLNPLSASGSSKQKRWEIIRFYANRLPESFVYHHMLRERVRE